MSAQQRFPWERTALASGIVGAVLFIAANWLFVAYVLPIMPPVDAPAADVARFYAQQKENTAYRLVSQAGMAQMLFLLPFFGGLFGVLRRAEQGGGPLAATVLAAGTAVAVIAPLAGMIEDHLLLGLAAAGADPVVVRAFDGLVPLSMALSGFPQALVLGGTAALVLASRVAPRWLGWTGLAVAALSLAGAAMPLVGSSLLFPLVALAALLFRVWVAALSVALIWGTPTVDGARNTRTAEMRAAPV